MSDCIFCKIIRKQIPAKIAFEDDEIIAFHDLSPQAPTHILLIPKRHLSSLNDATEKDHDLIGKLVVRAQKLAAELGISASGFRTVINTGSQGGQTVFHLHLHLLGGRPFSWPPG